LAVHLHKIITNDPLRTGVKESSTDSFVDTLLREFSFALYPLSLSLQDEFCFNVGQVRVTARPEFTVEKNFAVLLFDEDKHLHEKVGPNNEYGECQMAAEAIACAYRNFSDPGTPRYGQDQTIYAIRAIGPRFTFYRSRVSASYLHSLSDGFPPEIETVRVLRYPRSDNRGTLLGYDYTDPSERQIITQALADLQLQLFYA